MKQIIMLLLLGTKIFTVKENTNGKIKVKNHVILNLDWKY